LIKDITLQLYTGLTVVLLFVFLLSRARVFKTIMLRREIKYPEQVLLATFFGIIGILGTYNGLPVYGAIANNRAVGPIVAGLMAGPVVGLGAGLIAGCHRYMLGGFTAGTSAVSTILEGLLAGFIHHKFRYKKDRWFSALVVAFILEVFHMGLLLLIPKPLEQAVRLVSVIGPPMIIINSFGVAAFIAILDSVHRAQEKVEATAAQFALKIANDTLPYLRKGLNCASAQKTAGIIFGKVEELGAVAITSPDKILAFVGAGSDHHQAGNDVITSSTREVLQTGRFKLVQEKAGIGCPVAECPLSSKVVVPLKENNEVIGALVLYKLTENSITPFETELALGLGQLFSTQIEISRGQRQAHLLAQAEIRALQAQINPHFLFNALNTIVYYCRKEQETARDLLIHLGEFYRNNLSKLDKLVSLETEIKHVDSYVKIEQARFRDKLKVIYNIDPKCNCLIPPLILQPLVENAIKHGIFPKKEGGKVVITGKARGDKAYLIVEDDGVGMPPDLLEKVLQYDPKRKNIGLSNVHSRLQNIYGNSFGLKIESKLGKGTRVTVPIPLGENGAVF
jgi:two-component system sensor histidine kinase LytS